MRLRQRALHTQLYTEAMVLTIRDLIRYPRVFFTLIHLIPFEDVHVKISVQHNKGQVHPEHLRQVT